MSTNSTVPTLLSVGDDESANLSEAIKHTKRRFKANKCRFRGCTVGANFGDEQDRVRRFCAAHKGPTDVNDDVVEGYKGYVLNTYILEEISVSCGDQRGL